ncbi:DUF7601 domain-containing protein [Collinsella sp. HCP28S3_E12]|uniref:DUF7601 domain-containing protein n=1 Tax=unclassified Collinsella TaxID=2637548 RepID=UPI003F8912EB
MKLGRGSGTALIAAMCAIVLALFLVPIRTFAGEESAAETAASADATVTPSADDSAGTAGSSTDSTSAKTATGTSSATAATDTSSSSSPSELSASGLSSSVTGIGALANLQGLGANADVEGSAATPSLNATLQVASSTPIAVKSEIVNNISIHYVENGNERIILYCMNNGLAWPDSSEGSSIPYTEGYLTEDYFVNTLHKTKEVYEQCMKELEYLLYAGYPYNGMNLYTVTDKGKEITESEFNELLEVPDRLRSDFHEQLGDAVFTYSDYTQDYSDSSTNMYRIFQFFQKVWELGSGTTASGMTQAEVLSTDFYKAAFCMLNPFYGGTPGTPLAAYDNLYARNGSYVTIAQANDATQNAVWALLTTYGVPDNDIPESSYDSDSLVTKMLAAARAGANLQMTEPDSSLITVSGDTEFVFDPDSGTWRTGWITISEPETYRGVYTLSLPSGLTALAEDGTTATSVKAGTRFRISSSDKPTKDKNVELSTTLVWTEGIRQYSPQSGLVSPTSGKEYQHMLGEVIHTIKLSKNLTLQPAQDGHLKVSKKVTGEANSTTEFTFKVALDNTNINGTYGGMTFTNGVATVTLKDGEFATAEHLPAGTKYTVTEADSNSYRKSATDETGDIEDEKTAVAAFTNLRLYSLTVEKTVSGTANESSNQRFPIVITLKDANGDNVSDTFEYTGSVTDSGSVDKPADGSLAFTAGTATINLKAGQKIALSGIPSGYSYSVSEDNVTGGVYDDNDASHTSYTVTGTGSGKLDSDASVTITNTVRTGSLTVKKKVTKEVNPTSSFRITVTLSGAGTGLSGTYGAMTFNEGIATFDLKNNESITAAGLPEGTTYTVEENSYDDYTTTYAGNDGTIGVGTDSVVTVTNERKPIALPLSGSDGVGLTYLAGIVVLAAAAAWMHIRRNASAKDGDGRD